MVWILNVKKINIPNAENGLSFTNNRSSESEVSGIVNGSVF